MEDISGNKEKPIEKMKKFFEDIIYYIGPIQCALKSRETIIQIKEMFESGYTISEVLEVVATAADEFFNNARY